MWIMRTSYNIQAVKERVEASEGLPKPDALMFVLLCKLLHRKLDHFSSKLDFELLPEQHIRLQAVRFEPMQLLIVLDVELKHLLLLNSDVDDQLSMFINQSLRPCGILLRRFFLLKPVLNPFLILHLVFFHFPF